MQRVQRLDYPPIWDTYRGEIDDKMWPDWSHLSKILLRVQHFSCCHSGHILTDLSQGNFFLPLWSFSWSSHQNLLCPSNALLLKPKPLVDVGYLWLICAELSTVPPEFCPPLHGVVQALSPLTHFPLQWGVLRTHRAAMALQQLGPNSTDKSLGLAGLHALVEGMYLLNTTFLIIWSEHLIIVCVSNLQETYWKMMSCFCWMASSSLSGDRWGPNFTLPADFQHEML